MPKKKRSKAASRRQRSWDQAFEYHATLWGLFRCLPEKQQDFEAEVAKLLPIVLEAREEDPDFIAESVGSMVDVLSRYPARNFSEQKTRETAFDLGLSVGMLLGMHGLSPDLIAEKKRFEADVCRAKKAGATKRRESDKEHEEWLPVWDEAYKRLGSKSKADAKIAGLSLQGKLKAPPTEPRNVQRIRRRFNR